MRIFRTTDETIRQRDETIAKLKAEITVLELEREKLIQVIERDRMRVAAETAIYGTQIVNAERNDDESERRRAIGAIEY